MAAQDFAKKEVPIESIESPPSHQKMILILLVLLIVVLTTFMGGFWLGKKHGIEIAAGEDKARLEKLLRQQQNEVDQLREAAKQNKLPKVSTTQVGELTFYNELPRQDVQPTNLHADVAKKIMPVKPESKTHIPSASSDKIRKMIEEEMKQDVSAKHSQMAGGNNTVSASPVRAESKLAYMLQVGSFQQQNDAYAFLEKLRKKDMRSFVRRVELAEHGVWYRVYMGPYHSKKLANKAKNKVKNLLKIKGLVVKGH